MCEVLLGGGRKGTVPLDREPHLSLPVSLSLSAHEQCGPISRSGLETSIIQVTTSTFLDKCGKPSGRFEK